MSTSDSSLRAVIDSGLPPAAGGTKRVIVVGAGMAGLVAAFELLRAGHDPVVLEAQQRTGGRICPVADFTMDNPNGWICLHGQEQHIGDVATHPELGGYLNRSVIGPIVSEALPPRQLASADRPPPPRGA